jgi:FkbM family methyltransferase
MGIVSYAQNLEDVMLWRALGAHGPGFWIDVGAAHPTTDSVTRAFSERGWRGINIEPRDEEFALLVAERPNDVNLHLAVGARAGRTTFYDFEIAGHSTFDEATAARHRAAGRTPRKREVEVVTLAEICRRHVAGEVHFLKIDVEGAEREVLEGADFAACRPRIVVIEATLPDSPEDASAGWEPLLLAAGYRFAWFDGLNRFYIAAESWEALARHFTVQPNVFDGYRVAYPMTRTAGAEAALASARAQIERLRRLMAGPTSWGRALLRRAHAALRGEPRMRGRDSGD